ncbi:APH-domain-containing protein [Tilletiaria anomala UBC 951]|uniref:APH-domain-containing protein n=1 Tax=Tilletiaria anomala (strain ATCC 24038 / CBS 436.72 / UBC 951) TaxID=1037660 RepID=A0A066WH13_TILAU|nr:APH-domain-containing protein [Tilletiaria anomala UBC 951]KDN53111.1 APH-domain-containing protein [Tilletiaria anomala UBC 951]
MGNPIPLTFSSIESECRLLSGVLKLRSKALVFMFFWYLSLSGKHYVLRKKPPGQLVSATAHAVEREYRILLAIGKHNQAAPIYGNMLHPDAVPVPEVYCLCEDNSVLGTPFYIMEFLKGRIFSDVRMLMLPKEERAACWFAAIKTLAAMHRINPTAIGLDGYGKLANFYQRQLKSLGGVSVAQGKVKDKKTGKPVGPIPSFEDMAKWFAQNLPKDKNTICHGDYKIDNIVFHPTEPRVIGILDWELSTLGHPLSDLANLLQPFSLPCSTPSKVSDPDELERSRQRGDFWLMLGNLTPAQSPVPVKEELLKEYCEAARCEYPIPNWTFCEAWAWFRLAVIAQGIAARSAAGQASSAKAKEYGSMFPIVADGALKIIKASTGAVKAKL